MLRNRYQKISYDDLKKKAQESYNFQKASAVLGEYGFFTNLLKYDWLGADFLAQHIEGDWLKVQLKGRLTLDLKYCGKDIYIMFEYKETETWYLYPHDEFFEYVKKSHPDAEMTKKGFDRGRLSKWQKDWLEDFRI